MNNRFFLTILLVSSLFTTALFAQPETPTNTSSKYLLKYPTIRHFYVAGGTDGAIFSTATIHHDGATDAAGNTAPNINTMGIIRFTYMVNFGFTFNFNFSKHLGLYTGIDLKNVGYIEQDNGFSDKRRVYNVGAPLGIKIGNMSDKGSYLFLGGGLDVVLNYQEKYFSDRNNKTRINEWWSDRTPRTMPYLFAGISFNHHITVKAQYYPNNFLNTDYRDASGVAIYSGTDVHLILLSVGFGMNVSFKNDRKKDNCHNCKDCDDHHNM